LTSGYSYCRGFLTAVIVALAVAPVFGTPLSVALMVGAVLAASDPAILIPLFDDIRLRPRVAQTVIAESGFNDPVGTVFALAVAGAVASGEVALSGPAFEFVQSLFLCTLIGVVAGVALSYLVSTCRGGERRESPAVAILAVVALGYFSVETVGSSGYMAAFVMGLIVGNTEFLYLGQHDEHADLLEGFVSQVAEIVVLLAPQTNDDTLFTIHDRS
jgi:cell volume regulation protein A